MRVELRSVVLVALLLQGCGGGQSAPPASRAPGVSHTTGAVDEVAITVSDLMRSTTFFVDRLEAALIETRTIEGADLARLSGVEGAKARVAWLELGDERIVPSASIGVALFPESAREPEALMRLADEAMYRAKRAGGGRICLRDASGLRDVA